PLSGAARHLLPASGAKGMVFSIHQLYAPRHRLRHRRGARSGVDRVRQEQVRVGPAVGGESDHQIALRLLQVLVAVAPWVGQLVAGDVEGGEVGEVGGEVAVYGVVLVDGGADV